MPSGKILPVFFCSILFVAFALATADGAEKKKKRVPTIDTNTQIYLIRGLGNVHSLGLDQIAEKLKPHGFQPIIVSWQAEQETADAIASKYLSGQKSPIVLIGHSFGANTALKVGQRLSGRGIPVAYIVSIDMTEPLTVPLTTRHFVNFYQTNGYGKKAGRPQGFKGDMINVDVTNREDINHFNMDEAPKLHEIVIGKIIQIATGNR